MGITHLLPPRPRLRSLKFIHSTQSLLNDLERAVDDSVACVRGLCRDPRFVPGGGATEMELAHQIFKHGESQVRGGTLPAGIFYGSSYE